MKIKLTKEQIEAIAYEKGYKEAFNKGLKDGAKDSTPLVMLMIPPHQTAESHSDAYFSAYNGFDWPVEVVFRKIKNKNEK